MKHEQIATIVAQSHHHPTGGHFKETPVDDYCNNTWTNTKTPAQTRVCGGQMPHNCRKPVVPLNQTQIDKVQYRQNKSRFSKALWAGDPDTR